MKGPSLSYAEVSLTEFLKRDLGRLSGKNAIVYPAKITFGNCWAKADSLGTSLAKMGVRKGDKVCLLEWSSPEFRMAFNAVVEAGAVVVPLSPMSKELEVDFVANDTSAETMIVRDELYPRVRNVLTDVPSLKRIIVIGNTASQEAATAHQDRFHLSRRSAESTYPAGPAERAMYRPEEAAWRNSAARAAKRAESVRNHRERGRPPASAASSDQSLRNAWSMAALTILLIGYQLRRKHRLLRPQRFTF